jgi:transposase
MTGELVEVTTSVQRRRRGSTEKWLRRWRLVPVIGGGARGWVPYEPAISVAALDDAASGLGGSGRGVGADSRGDIEHRGSGDRDCGGPLRVTGSVDPEVLFASIDALVSAARCRCFAFQAGGACGSPQVARTCARVRWARASVQDTLCQDPHSGHLFLFRSRRGDLIKMLLARQAGAMSVREGVAAGPLYLALAGQWGVGDHARAARLLLERIDWRARRRTWVPETAGCSAITGSEAQDRGT